MVLSANKVPYLALCNVLEAVQNRKNHTKKKKVLQKFVDEWRKSSFDINDQDDSFHSILRCIIPQLEKVAYGIKEKSLALLYIEVMGLGKRSDAASSLLNFHRPLASGSMSKMAGDFAEVAFSVLKDRCSIKPKLSVQDVVDQFSEIANGYANNDKKVVKSALEFVIRNLTGLENKWFIRMLLKDMKLGLGQDSVLSCVHPDAPALYSVDTSLERICKTLRDITKRLHEIEVSLFAHLKPMLGKQAKPTEVEQLLQTQNFIIETKFDGERMQLHMKDGEYKYYSRNGHDYTDTYGSSEYVGNLTPLIQECLKGVQSVILDGEMCGFDTELQVLSSKAKNFDIKSANIKGYQPCYMVFDMLYLNGEVLTNKSLRERQKRIKECVKEKEGRLMISQPSRASTNQQCIDALNQAIDRYEEGIMIKHPDSVYKPNSRTAGWYKIKPEYVDGLMDELDVVIIGGYFGKGRRAKVVSHFLCAVMDKKDERTKFLSVCRVGSGYSYKELLDFNLAMKDKWVKTKPSGVVVSREKAEVWIEPSNSAILQIKATEVVESNMFSTGYTLRFPRVEKIREDKEWRDCLTLKEFTDLRQKSSGKLTGKLADLTDDLSAEEPSVKRKKRGAGSGNRAVAPTLGQQFRGADVTNITKEADVFVGKEFCVVNGPEEFDKHTLEKEIVRLGGTIVQNAGAKTFAIIAHHLNLRANNYIKANKYNVAKASWLISCIDKQQVTDWLPNDLHGTSPDVQAVFDEQFDDFGDSYYRNTSVQTLKQTFQKLKEFKNESVRKVVNIREIEQETGTDQDYSLSLFRSCGLIDGSLITGQEDRGHAIQLALLSARFYGATVETSVNNQITHCLCNRGMNVVKLQEDNHERLKKFHIVTPAWVDDSITAGKVLSERSYPPLSN